MADDGIDFSLNIDTGGAVSGTTKLDSSLGDLQKHLMSVDSHLGKVKTGADHASSGFGGLAHSFMHIIEISEEWKLAEMLEEIPAKLMELGEDMVKVAAHAERTESSFKLLFGEHGGGEALEDIDEIGKHTEFTHARIRDLTAELGKAGFDGQGLKEARAAILDMAAISPNKEMGLDEATSVMNRLKLTGRIEGRSLGRAGINKDNYFAELGERMGVSRKQVEKEMEAGKVDAETAMKALEYVITQKTGKALGGAGDEMSKTFEAKLTHLGELKERYFEKLSHGPGFAQLGDTLGHVLDALDPESDNGKKIFGGLENAFDNITTKIAGIDIASVLQKGADIIGDMPYALEAVGKTIQDIGHFLSPLVTGFEAVAGAVDKVINLVAPGQKDDAKYEFRMEHPEEFAKSRALDAELKRKRLLEKYGHGDEFVQDPSTVFKVVGKSASDGAAGGLKAGDATVESAAAEHVGGAAEKGARKRLDSHSPSRLFEDIGMDTAEGYARGIGKGGDRVSGALDDMIPTVASSGQGGGARSVTMEAHITVHVPAGAPNAAEVKEAARQGAALALSEFQSGFDSMAVQAGAA